MIHQLADVQSKEIGEGTSIWQFVVVLNGSRIGKNCNINCNCFVEDDVIIGNSVTVKSGVYIWKGVRIEDDVFVGPCVAFTNDIFPRSKKYPSKFANTTIKRGASIGANATILAGITVGEFSLIGAGSVVSKDVPAYSYWYGNPATMHGYICACGTKLEEDLQCMRCGARYLKSSVGILRTK